MSRNRKSKSSTDLGRRHFLRGAGGFALALPFLPSLAMRRALAGTAPYSTTPRFVSMASQHGGISESNMYPSGLTLAETTLYSGGPTHIARRANLAAPVTGGRAAISPILTAGSTILTPAMLAKLNVLRGLDIMMYLGHHKGGYLGYLQASDQISEGNKAAVAVGPTIDQVLAWSNKFYPSLTGVPERSMNMCLNGGAGSSISWGWSNPVTKSGSISPLPVASSARALFDRVFPSSGGSNNTAFIVDRALEHFRSLTRGAFGDATRLSTSDRLKVNDHMERMYELQRKVSTTVSCGEQAPPVSIGNSFTQTSLEDCERFYKLYNDVIVAAFICGTSRIATLAIQEEAGAGVSYTSAWHQDVAHHFAETDPQAKLAATQQFAFEKIFLDLCAKLNIEEANGLTYLDNSLVALHHEAGPETHMQDSLPTITAGSAAGMLNTGLYVDYRNLNSGKITTWGDVSTRYPGLPYDRWWVTVLQAMGLSPSDYESGGKPGYGGAHCDTSIEAGRGGPAAWPDRVRADLGVPLPFIWKS